MDMVNLTNQTDAARRPFGEREKRIEKRKKETEWIISAERI